MIPPRSKIEEIKKELAHLMNLPSGWKIEVEVKPYLGFDVGYEIDEKNKTIHIKIYSGRFPQSYEEWKYELSDTIKSRMGWGWVGRKWNIVEFRNIKRFPLEGAEYRIIDTVTASNVKDALRKYMGQFDEIAYTYISIDGKTVKLYYLIPRSFFLKDPNKPPVWGNILRVEYQLPKYGAFMEL